MTTDTDLALADPLGLKRCELPGYEHIWVQFATRGYPFRLRREWDEANGPDTVGIVLRYVTAWNVADVDGQAVALPAGPRTLALLDNVEEAVVVWLVRAFQRVWLFDLTVIRPNSSAPSPST